MKNRIVLLLVFVCQLNMAQTITEEKKNDDTTSSLGILLGVHGARETIFEIGFFKNNWFGTGKYQGGSGFSVSTEHYINENYIIAPKVTAFSNLWGIHLGISSVWYFDMEKNNSLRFRPEIGYSRGRFKLTYGLNLSITNKNMSNISKHMLSFVYFINFDKKANQIKPDW